MFVKRLSIENVRSIEKLVVELSEGVNVIWGPNGTGKTSIIEALFYAMSGRSCKTNDLREIISYGKQHLRIEVDIESGETDRKLEAAYDRSLKKICRFEGVDKNPLTVSPDIPLVGAFLPEKLEVVKGPPGHRRAHIDSYATLVWPSIRDASVGYRKVLAQRNRIISASGKREEIRSWDSQLAEYAYALTSTRDRAVSSLKKEFSRAADRLGLGENPIIEYRPSIGLLSEDDFRRHYEESIENDIAKGYTSTGPHRDDVIFKVGGRSIRKYGSQGEQRMAILAFYLAERQAVKEKNQTDYILLLDDVMSELDSERRELLTSELENGGQSVITTTERDSVPNASRYRSISIEAETGRVEM